MDPKTPKRSSMPQIERLLDKINILTTRRDNNPLSPTKVSAIRSKTKY